MNRGGARACAVVALHATLAACGGAVRPVAAREWYPRAAVAPAPGRVPLQIESRERAQQVGLRRDVAAAARPASSAERGAPRVAVCVTPCTLYVAPGVPVAVHAGGFGVRAFVTVLTPGPRGERLRLRAPRERDHTAANAAATGGALLALLGVIFAVAGPIEYATGSASGVSTTILGGALLGAGAAFWVPSFVALRGLEPGVEARAPLAAGAAAAFAPRVGVTVAF